MLKCAILCQLSDGSYHLFFKEERMIPIEFPRSLEDFLPIFEQHDFDVLWIMPNTHFSKLIGWSDFEKLDKDRVRIFPTDRSKSQKGQPAFVSIRRVSNHYEKDRYFAFPAHGEWTADGQWFISSPLLLAQTINYLTKEFQTDILWGPGNMGMKVLKRIFEKRG